MPNPYQWINDNPGIKWKSFIPIEFKPIQYLEIGVATGDNAVAVANSYCLHPGSKLHLLDPWSDYDGYTEYVGEQDKAYNIAMETISPYAHKSVIHRGFSDNIVPTFEDSYFDIIFVDGNHETEFVYRDGVMSFQKVKSGGHIIFDDYVSSHRQTIEGIDKFLEEYKDKIHILARPTNSFWQVIVQKL